MPAPASLSSRLVLVSAFAASGVVALPARADPAETESRLKSIGVPAPLRARIRTSIDRGVARLAALQRADGHWEDRWYPGWTTWGVTALCALAQRHAGTADGVASARRAMAWLEHEAGPASTPRAQGPVPSVLDNVYAAGLWLLCLHADGRSAAEAAPTARALEQALDVDSSWWGYDTRSPRTTTPNLSTSQFAALGLEAATRIGVNVDPGVWDAHLGGLCAAQVASGSWPYAPGARRARAREVPVADHAYPATTFMGCANLAFAIAGRRDARDPLAPAVAAVRAKALARLEKEGRAFVEAMDGSRPSFAYSRESGFSYYALYALERACVLNDLPTLGGIAWYVRGAEALLAMQGEDGSWTCRGDVDPLASTSFSLLFLLRATESLHPTTPRPVDSGPPAATTTPR
jgi:hypothetical protein